MTLAGNSKTKEIMMTTFQTSFNMYFHYISIFYDIFYKLVIILNEYYYKSLNDNEVNIVDYHDHDVVVDVVVVVYALVR